VFVARLLTMGATLRRQQRDVLDYLTATCVAGLTGAPSPPLLPPARETTLTLPLPAAA